MRVTYLISSPPLSPLTTVNMTVQAPTKLIAISSRIHHRVRPVDVLGEFNDWIEHDGKVCAEYQRVKLHAVGHTSVHKLRMGDSCARVLLLSRIHTSAHWEHRPVQSTTAASG